MAVETSSGALKLCCKCGKDVTHVGRMKDSEGRYWCIDCGAKDEERRGEHSGGSCHSCGEPFGKPQLVKLHGKSYCHKCAQKAFGVKRSFLSKVWANMTGKA
jgi:formylmethanofuran dehydrogenase subunit E